MRMRSVVSVVLGCLVVGQASGPLRGEPDAVERGLPAALAEAVKVIFTRVLVANEGLRVGMPKAEVAEHTQGAADVVGDLTLALSETPYAPTPEWKGVVRCWVSDKEDRVTELSVRLLTGPYDVAQMKRHVIAVGKELGIRMEESVGNTRSLHDWDDVERDREIWVGMGKGVLVIEVSPP